MKPWAEIAADMEAATQAQFGERVIVEPMTAGGDFIAASPDPARPVFDGAALLDIPRPYSADVSGVDARVAYHDARVEIDRADLPEGWDFRKGDEVTAPDRPGSPRYQVMRVDATDLTHLALMLSPIAPREA